MNLHTKGAGERKLPPDRQGRWWGMEERDVETEGRVWMRLPKG